MSQDGDWPSPPNPRPEPPARPVAGQVREAGRPISTADVRAEGPEEINATDRKSLPAPPVPIPLSEIPPGDARYWAVVRYQLSPWAHAYTCCNESVEGIQDRPMLVVAALRRAGNYVWQDYDEPTLVCTACGREQEPEFGMLERRSGNDEATAIPHPKMNAIARIAAEIAEVSGLIENYREGLDNSVDPAAQIGLISMEARVKRLQQQLRMLERPEADAGG